MVVIDGHIGILLQFIGMSTLGISVLLLAIQWTGVFNKHTNNKIHNRKNQHKKQWFFDVEEKIA